MTIRLSPTKGTPNARRLPDLWNQRPYLRPVPGGFDMPQMRMTADELAIRRLALAGYLIRDKAVWYIANDDLDTGLELLLVGNSYGPQDDYMFLIGHDWPHSNDEVFCPECREAEVAFGEVCPVCSVQVVYETRGEMASDYARGK